MDALTNECALAVLKRIVSVHVRGSFSLVMGPNFVVNRSTASDPAIARRIASESYRSTSTGSAPRHRTNSDFSLPRAVDRTLCPASTSARKLARPRTPVPPATKTFINIATSCLLKEKFAQRHQYRQFLRGLEKLEELEAPFQLSNHPSLDFSKPEEAVAYLCFVSYRHPTRNGLFEHISRPDQLRVFFVP